LKLICKNVKPCCFHKKTRFLQILTNILIKKLK
jgi:hypothetical protein